MALFTGSGTALATPFTQDGLDLEGFGRLVDFQLANGTDALIVCGTTGEPPTMTPAEYEQAVGFVVGRAAGRVPVVAGAGSNDTRHAIALCRKAADLGADAALVVTPYYNKTTQAGLVAHFTAVAGASPLPLILYNVPARTGLNMQPATVAALADHPNIIAVKEASGDLAQVTDIARLCQGKIDLYSGEDGIVLPTLACGGIGVISVVSNITPRAMHDLVARYLAGDAAGARALQFQLKPLVDALFMETSPAPVKAALELMGICPATVRLPLVPLSAAARAVLVGRMRDLQLIA